MIPKNTFADGLRYAALIVGDFDPFDGDWTEADQKAAERVLDLLHKRLNEVADEYAPGPVTAPEVRVGGEPPKLEIGMVVSYVVCGIVYNTLVCASPYVLSDVIEVRAPWGGPVIWRAR